MEKNNKVKIKFKGVKVFSYFLCLTLMIAFMQDVLAQEKQKEVKVKLSVLNGDEKAITLPTDHKIKLYANGAEVYAKCVKTTCVAGYNCSKWKCLPSPNCSDNGDGSMKCKFSYLRKSWCSDNQSDQTNYDYKNVYPQNACETTAHTIRDKFSCGFLCWTGCQNGGSQKVASNRECLQQVCKEAEVCTEWEIQADSVLSLMPEVGLSMIDPNLIEY